MSDTNTAPPNNTLTRGHVTGAAAGAFALLAVTFISNWEGMDLVAHHQAIDPAGINVFCIGEDGRDDPTVRVGQRFTVQDCKDRFVKLLPRYDACVKKAIPGPMADETHVAFLSFSYNLGCGRLYSSGISRDMKDGNVRKACNDMRPYIRANGKVLRGLQSRRAAEIALCLKGAK